MIKVLQVFVVEKVRPILYLDKEERRGTIRVDI